MRLYSINVAWLVRAAELVVVLIVHLLFEYFWRAIHMDFAAMIVVLAALVAKMLKIEGMVLFSATKTPSVLIR